MIYEQTKSVQENNMHKILWDFEIQADHPMLARIPDLMFEFECEFCLTAYQPPWVI